MKTLPAIFLPLLVLAAGCGDDTSGAGGAGSGGATTTSSTSGTTTTSSSTGEGGGATTAATTSASTGGEGGAGGGTTGSGGAAAVTPACEGLIEPDASPSAGACVDREVAACNPVTNDGCGEGEQCDIGNNPGEYECYTQGPQMCGQECDDISLFCLAGATCTFYFPEAYPEADFQCARFCCNDEDCNGGRCVSNGDDATHPGLGMCFE